MDALIIFWRKRFLVILFLFYIVLTHCKGYDTTDRFGVQETRGTKKLEVDNCSIYKTESVQTWFLFSG